MVNKEANPARVEARQERLRSGGYGTHRQVKDLPRGEQKRKAIQDHDEEE